MRRLRAGLAAVLLGILCFHSMVFASVDKLNISQIVQKGNDVYLYVNALDSAGKPAPDSVSAEQLSVNIDKGESLPVQEAAVFQSLNQGVSYIFCIDVSKSVTEQEMQEIRSSMTEFVNGMSANDYARIITIGTEVTALCNSTTDHNALNTAIQSVARVADYTYLYKGISFALDGQRKSVDTMPERAALVLFTDGMDDSDGASSEEQVLVDIAETRIPIYVVGLKGNDAAANLNSVGQIARQSGGSVFSYSDMSITAAVQNIGNLMRSAYRLHVQPGESSFGKQNLVWSAAYSSDGYTVSSTNYVYSLGMDNVVIAEPTPTEAPSPTPEPTEEPSPTPEPEPEPEESFMDKAADFVKDNWIVCVIVILAAAALIGVVVWFIQKRKRDNGEIEVEPVSPNTDKTYMTGSDETMSDQEDDETVGEDDMDSDETIGEINDGRLRLTFEITFDGRTETVEKVIDDKLTLGRGNECDVDVVLHSSIEERKLTSRVHAFILNHPDGLYVKDNSSRNKTYLNGVEVLGEVTLRDEDILQLGKASVKVKIPGAKGGYF